VLVLAAGFAGCASPIPTAPPPISPSTPSPATNPWAGTEYIDKTYEWTYWRFDDVPLTWSVRIPTSLYEDYHTRPRPATGDYTVYAADDGDREILADLGARLMAYVRFFDLEEYEAIHFMAAFVQQLEYTTDADTTGFDDYGRYPIETLVEDGGDCEDTAILLGKLMDTLGYDVVLVRLPEHMALGVKEGEKFVGTYYKHEGVKYFYLETTGSAGRIGIVPEEYEGQAAYIYDFSPRPILTHTWNGERSGATYTLRVTVENFGGAAVEGCTIRQGSTRQRPLVERHESEPFALARRRGGRGDVPRDTRLPAHAPARLRRARGLALDKSQSRWSTAD
jgi:hypothetical protein